MTIEIDIPGRPRLALAHLVLDVNGTLTERGQLLPGVEERLERLRVAVGVQLLSADTYGTLAALATRLSIEAERVASGAEKLSVINRLGPEGCAVIGNGANDVEAMSAAGLAVCVVGGEGAATDALLAADIVVRSIAEGLDLLLDPMQLVATLRG